MNLKEFIIQLYIENRVDFIFGSVQIIISIIAFFSVSAVVKWYKQKADSYKDVIEELVENNKKERVELRDMVEYWKQQHRECVDSKIGDITLLTRIQELTEENNRLKLKL